MDTVDDTKHTKAANSRQSQQLAGEESGAFSSFGVIFPSGVGRERAKGEWILARSTTTNEWHKVENKNCLPTRSACLLTRQ